MKYKIEEMIDGMEKTFPRNEYLKDMNIIYDSIHNIIVFERDWVPSHIGEIDNDLYKNVVNAMNTLNNYYQKYKNEKLFNFDADDWRSVLDCASKMNRSCVRYSIEHPA